MHTFVISTLFALTTSAAPARLSADDFFVAVSRMSVEFADLEVHVDLGDGLDLELGYHLRGLGPVAIAVHEDPDGSGHGLVRVRDVLVAEVGFTDGEIDWQATNFVGLTAIQVQAIAASVMQVWHQDTVLDAFAGESLPSASCSDKCATAGFVSGVTVGVLGGGACYVILKLGKPCAKGAVWAGAVVGSWISGSCLGLACS